jgi:hypothetical protein
MGQIFKIYIYQQVVIMHGVGMQRWNGNLSTQKSI